MTAPKKEQEGSDEVKPETLSSLPTPPPIKSLTEAHHPPPLAF